MLNLSPIYFVCRCVDEINQGIDARPQWATGVWAAGEDLLPPHQFPVLPADPQAADRTQLQPQDKRPHCLQRTGQVQPQDLGHGDL